MNPIHWKGLLLCASALMLFGCALPWTMHDAARSGDIATIEKVLAKGGDPNSPVMVGLLPIHSAAQGGHVAAIQKLLDAGASIDGRVNGGEDGDSPLVIALRFGNFEAADYLIRAGADIEARSYHYETPLMLAAKYGAVDTVVLLLERHADLNAADQEGVNALLLACQGGSLDIVQKLVESGADVNYESRNFFTPLKNAMGSANRPITQFLIDHGADLNGINTGGSPPIMAAAAWGNPEVLDRFLEAGINVNSQTSDGATALHYSASTGKQIAFEMLVASGADIAAKSTTLGTPLHAAARNNRIRIAMALIQLGAKPSEGLDTTKEDAIGTGLEHMLFADEAIRRADKELATRHYVIAKTYIERAGEAYRIVANEAEEKVRDAASKALIARLNQPIGLPGYSIIAGSQTDQLAEVVAMDNANDLAQYANYRQAYEQVYSRAVSNTLDGSRNLSDADLDAALKRYQRISSANSTKHALASKWLEDIDRKLNCTTVTVRDSLLSCLDTNTVHELG